MKLAALLLAISSTASANALVASDEPEAPAKPRFIDARIGMLVGGADVGDADGFSIGISAGLGYKIGDVTLRGLVDYYKVGDNADETLQRHGRATRAGGAVRYSFANNGDEPGLGIDFWGELGAGYEHVAWLHGGVLDRPDAELAFGLDLSHRSELDRRGSHHDIGYFMAFRSFVGEAPEMNLPPTCGGPCTKATPPPRTDVSMFFELGVHWGH